MAKEVRTWYQPKKQHTVYTKLGHVLAWLFFLALSGLFLTAIVFSFKYVVNALW